MKKLLTGLMVLLFGLIFLNCTSIKSNSVKDNLVKDSEAKPQNYTYDGQFDPIKFYTWDIIMSWHCERGHLHIALKNPNKDSDIPVVETMNIPDGENMSIVAYRYLKGSVMYVFTFNKKTFNYDQVEPKIDKSGGI